MSLAFGGREALIPKIAIQLAQLPVGFDDLIFDVFALQKGR